MGMGMSASPICRSAVLLGLLAVPAPGETGPWFLEGVELPFQHQNAATGRLSFPEMMGGGVGLADLDGDGRLDLLLIDSGGLDPGGAPRRDLFLRNLGSGPDGHLRFEPFAPLPAGGGYGMGVATGDVDGDGLVDVVLTGLHGDRLLRNLGAGRFEDWTTRAGLDGSRWSSAAVLADLDGDGDLDLFLGSYVRFDLAREPSCFAPSSRPDYCGPSAFPAAPDRLLLNDGSGRFADASVAWGVSRHAEPALGAIAFDADGNGRLELYVANDGAPNHLWALGKGEDSALLAGLAVNVQGRPEAGMGVVAADFDGDGREDLLLTHLAAETHTLYRNEGEGFFLDVTATSGLGPPSLARTGFGVCALDANLDGLLDVVVVNGAVRRAEERLQAGHDPLAERPQLFLGLGRGRFREATVAEAGPIFGEELVGRGLACGDIDGDGDMDLLIGVNGGRPRLLLGQAIERGRRSVSVRVVQRNGRSDELGALVTLETALPERGLDRRTARIRTDGSYLAAHEPRVVFALRTEEKVVGVAVRYADGEGESFDVPTGTQVTLTRGKGLVRAGGHQHSQRGRGAEER